MPAGPSQQYLALEGTPGAHSITGDLEGTPRSIWLHQRLGEDPLEHRAPLEAVRAVIDSAVPVLSPLCLHHTCISSIWFFLFNSSSLPALLWHREVAQILPFSAQMGSNFLGQHQSCPSLPGLRVEELFWVHWW